MTGCAMQHHAPELNFSAEGKADCELHSSRTTVAKPELFDPNESVFIRRETPDSEQQGGETGNLLNRGGGQSSLNEHLLLP